MYANNGNQLRDFLIHDGIPAFAMMPTSSDVLFKNTCASKTHTESSNQKYYGECLGMEEDSLATDASLNYAVINNFYPGHDQLIGHGNPQAVFLPFHEKTIVDTHYQIPRQLTTEDSKLLRPSLNGPESQSNASLPSSERFPNRRRKPLGDIRIAEQCKWQDGADSQDYDFLSSERHCEAGDITFADGSVPDELFNNFCPTGRRRSKCANVRCPNKELVGKVPQINRLTASKSSLIYTTTSVEQCENNLSLCSDEKMDSELISLFDTREQTSRRGPCLSCDSIPFDEFCQYCEQEKMFVHMSNSSESKIHSSNNNYSICRKEHLSVQTIDEHILKRPNTIPDTIQEETDPFVCELLSALSNHDSCDECVTSVPIVYLNKSQKYILRIGRTSSIDETIKVMLVLTIYSDRTGTEQYEAWQHWYSKTKLEVRQRPLKCDQQYFLNTIGYPEEIAYNAIVFYWNPSIGDCEVGFSVTGLTTEFKYAKYGKENRMELHLIILGKDYSDQKVTRMKCAIRVFSEKQGAERKIREERRKRLKMSCSQIRSKAHGSTVTFQTVNDYEIAPVALFIPRNVLETVMKVAGGIVDSDCSGGKYQRKRRMLQQEPPVRRLPFCDHQCDMPFNIGFNYGRNDRQSQPTKSDSNFGQQHLY